MEDAGKCGSGTDGACHILSPHFVTSSTLLSPQMCTSYRAGVGLRRPIIEREAYGNGFLSSPKSSVPSPCPSAGYKTALFHIMEGQDWVMLVQFCSYLLRSKSVEFQQIHGDLFPDNCAEDSSQNYCINIHHQVNAGLFPKTMKDMMIPG